MDVTATVERGVSVTDSALAYQVTRRQLGVLACLTGKQRSRLTETFGAWLKTRGTAAEIADRLQVTRRRSGTGCGSSNGPSATSSATPTPASPWRWCFA
jgi:hypothetical protein